MDKVPNNEARSTRIAEVIEKSRQVRARSTAARHAAAQALEHAFAISLETAELMQITDQRRDAVLDPAEGALYVAKASSDRISRISSGSGARGTRSSGLVEDRPFRRLNAPTLPMIDGGAR